MPKPGRRERPLKCCTSNLKSGRRARGSDLSRPTLRYLRAGSGRHQGSGLLLAVMKHQRAKMRRKLPELTSTLPVGRRCAAGWFDG